METLGGRMKTATQQKFRAIGFICLGIIGAIVGVWWFGYLEYSLISIAVLLLGVSMLRNHVLLEVISYYLIALAAGLIAFTRSKEGDPIFISLIFALVVIVAAWRGIQGTKAYSMHNSVK